MLFLKIETKTHPKPIRIRARGICIVWKSTKAIPIKTVVIKEKITESKNGRLKKDHNQGKGQINSRIKLFFLIL